MLSTFPVSSRMIRKSMKPEAEGFVLGEHDGLGQISRRKTRMVPAGGDRSRSDPYAKPRAPNDAFGRFLGDVLSGLVVDDENIVSVRVGCAITMWT